MHLELHGRIDGVWEVPKPQIYNNSYEAEITPNTLRVSHCHRALLQTFSSLNVTIILEKKCRMCISSFHRSGN